MSAIHACEVCDAKVHELRRGRCWGCYARWVDSRPVGIGARCLTCAEKRRRVLKMVELYGNWKPMCFNCAGQLLTLDPMPETIAELKIAVSRERRDLDRRNGKTDTRVFKYERRVGERRLRRSEDVTVAGDTMRPEVLDDDEIIIEITFEDDTADIADAFASDLTQIRALVHELRPPDLR